MNKEKLLELVEALREAGQQDHGDIMAGGDIEVCPGIEGNNRFCECGAANHNAAVDAAAKALVAEIEQMFDTSAQERRRAEEDEILNDFRTGSR